MTPPLWITAISRDERRELERIVAWRSWATILVNWIMVFGAMALVAWWPNPLTVVAALVVIGTRQLGMAVVMHEASHNTLFASRTWNDRIGNWLAAYPIWTDIAPYRAYHMQHHANTGGPDDPDLNLAAPFPVTPASFRRKVWRDLSGQTGLKQAVAVCKRDLGIDTRRTQRDLSFNRGAQAQVGWHKLAPVVLTNGVLLALLWLAGHPALYLLWVGAWLTTFRLVTRLRSIAEHAMTPDPSDPLRNTRTTRARWWERLLVAPNRVNFHLEHHLMIRVPHYNLPRLHRMLRERGVLDGACLAPGYASILQAASSRA